MKVQKTIEEIFKKIQDLQNNYSPSPYEFTYCFRGEAQDYGETKLTPTLFREKGFGGKLPDKELINLITDYRISDADNISSLSKAIEGQHFLALSRLLDVTFSILPSIFFAASSSFEENGYVYVFQFPKTYSPNSSYINDYYEQLITREIVPYYQNFKVLSHTQSNERIKSQSGGFILFPGSEIKPMPEIYYKKVEIKSSDKKDILDELDAYFNMNESTIYPEKDKKRELIRKKLHTISSDIKNKDNKISFYEAEIEETLVRINFECSALKRAGKSGIDLKRILKRELRDLIGYIDNIDLTDGEKKDDKNCIDFIEQQKIKVSSEFSKWQAVI